jgi:phage shock protein PspC (stress-responsive transcriptional regulator)
MQTNPIFGEPDPDPADPPQPLRRAHDGRVLAGVASGLARYLDVDVSLVRLGFGALVVVGGIGIPAYLACWLLVPDEETDTSLADDLMHGVGGHGAGWPGAAPESGWADGDFGVRARGFADRAEAAVRRTAEGGPVR